MGDHGSSWIPIPCSTKQCVTPYYQTLFMFCHSSQILSDFKKILQKVGFFETGNGRQLIIDNSYEILRIDNPHKNTFISTDKTAVKFSCILFSNLYKLLYRKYIPSQLFFNFIFKHWLSQRWPVTAKDIFRLWNSTCLNNETSLFLFWTFKKVVFKILIWTALELD